MFWDFIDWIRPAFEGNDGKASQKKLLVAYMTILFTIVVVCVGFFNFYFPEPVYYIISGVIIGQSVITSWQNVKDHGIEKDKEVEEIRNETRKRRNID
jgi:uncharacterized membrane protein YdbT with pleckstrin-like domain